MEAVEAIEWSLRDFCGGANSRSLHYSVEVEVEVEVSTEYCTSLHFTSLHCLSAFGTLPRYLNLPTFCPLGV